MIQQKVWKKTVETEMSFGI